MAGDVKRQYRSPARAAAAAATRAAIRAAAAELFVEVGFSATTMRAVAARAGVGERTLYDAFANKGALFEHVVSVAIAGDEDTAPVAARPEFVAALTERDPDRAVAIFADYSSAILERAAPVITVAIESAGADATLRRFSERGAAGTRANVSAFVQQLADHGHLKGDPDTVAMAAYACLVPLVHQHQHLRRHVGWTSQQYRTWLEETLARLLLNR